MTARWACAALAVLVTLAAWQVWVIPQSGIRMEVGPARVPAVVVGLLGGLVIAYGLQVWRRDDAAHDPPEPGAARRVLSLLVGGAVFCAGVPWLGFVLPATLCGMGVARAFEAPVGLRSALVCAAVSMSFWLLFAQLLGVGLGPAFAWTPSLP